MTRRYRLAANALTSLFAISTLLAGGGWLFLRILGGLGDPGMLQDLFITANIPMTYSLVSAIVLALITVGLFRHKRLALNVVILIQVLGALTAVLDLLTLHLNSGLDSIEEFRDELTPYLVASIVIAFVAIPLLVKLRPAFPARVPKGSWPAATAVFALGLALTVGLTHVLIVWTHDTHGPSWRQLLTALFHALGLGSPRGWMAPVGHVIPQLAAVIMGLTLVAAVAIFLRSGDSLDSWRPENELTARALLAKYGEDDSLGYYATRRDKLLHFSHDRSSAIAYRVVGGVALASGDPLGAPADWPEAIESWDTYTRSFGWTPAVLACGEEGARAYRKVLGFDILRLGDEAILTTERFQLSSTALTEVRHTVKRLRRKGMRVEIHRAMDLDQAELSLIETAADQWRTGDVERGFSMALGRFGDPADQRVVVARVYDEDGTMVALQTFVPWGRHGLSLDLMRRSPHAPNGTNEFLVAELMMWAANHGVSRVSLNFAFFRHIFAEAEDVAASSVSIVSSRLLGFFDRFWQLQRLYRSNSKYNPAWQPRYVALSNPLSVLGASLAAAQAEGFMPTPPWRRSPLPDGQLSAADLEHLRLMDLPPQTDDWAAGAGDQTQVRLGHLSDLEAGGRQGYPVGRRLATPLADLADATGADSNAPTSLVARASDGPFIGRVRRIRDHGGVVFVDVVDGHTTVQVLLDAAKLTPEALNEFTRLVDGGDLLEITGHAGASNNGTPSVILDEWTMLAKCLHPIPWEGLNDPQVRLRNRSLDMLTRPVQVDLLVARSKAIQAVRSTLLDDGYLEVETPILGTTHGGATARPFRTHINAYDTDLVLRIAPELQLKRLVVGGMGKIFEIGRNFRNEGADATHNPEFTVVEAYAPLTDYVDMRLITQKIIQQAALAVHGRMVMPLPGPEGVPVLTDISGDWPVVEVCAAVSEVLGVEVNIDTDLDELLELAAKHNVEIPGGRGCGAVIEELYGELVEAQTMQPTFYVDFPAETSPLTAPHRLKPGLVERWDLVAGGTELGTAYSELADPVIQRQRLLEQSWLAAQGDMDAMEVDEDFLSALELGMPPMGGLGLGLDRIVMALTGTNIRQILAFPFARPL
ncbi:MAG: bifunctional lysylphosphatidylglycerol synthetase/lysine--tRNA ligase LysX [Actinomycetaceae bacterium]|nr:bifunctional lysylphosphatidylglycerol synthetase/lysine--tRNA ligase LysX [Actinomycetaceae bacterium]